MPSDLEDQPTAVVANLPYNVAVPALLHLLAQFPTIRTVMVMVQLEVPSDSPPSRVARTTACPARRCASTATSVATARSRRRSSGRSRASTPAWFARSLRDVAWPVEDGFRKKVFELIDIAFAQRRKTSRNAFAEWAGSGNESAERLLSASIDPARRGETLGIADFVRLLQRSGQVESAPRQPNVRVY